jgi:hypothetical protein
MVGDGANGTPLQAADPDESRPGVIETKYVRLQSG